MKNLLTGFRVLFVLTFLTGILYPLAITALGSLLFKEKAQGSLLTKDGSVVGSKLLAQAFTSEKYFWPRPSAVKYDSASSGASNLGLTSADLVKNIQERTKKGFVDEMLFDSGSGLDPHIGRRAALSQVERISTARKLRPEQTSRLAQLVNQALEQRQFGFLGEERINVLELNLALDEAF